MNIKNPSENLLIGRRPLDGIPEIKLLADWTWDKVNKKWYLHCNIDIQKASIYVQETTNWYIVVDSSYPKGEIKFYPDVNNSIEVTFPHQSCNREINKNGLWRNGGLCLENNITSLGKLFNTEPYAPHERLSWHARRAIKWIIAAADNKLASDGDFFELPFFPIKIADTIVFSEDIITFMQWDSLGGNYGFVETHRLENNPKIYVIKNFYDINKKIVKQNQWGKYINNNIEKNSVLGLWIMLKAPPIIPPWGVPWNIEELKRICIESDINFIDIIKKVAPSFRDRVKHIVLLGFPIPDKIGEANSIIYWKAFLLPILSYGKQTANGFRPNERGQWVRDKLHILKDQESIEWVNTENWNNDAILTRGRLPRVMTSKSILLIGAGTIGSSVAELLVRAGTYDITIIDGDLFNVGNLSRHSLGITDIKNSKATKLRDRLNEISVHANVESIDSDYSMDFKLDQYDVILDCTGNDDVFDNLSNIKFTESKIFISISVSLGAKRLFCFMDKSTSFSYQIFLEKINKYIQMDIEEYKDKELPREGIGCWHPLFPARADDIWLAASTATKVMEHYICNLPDEPKIEIYEQRYSNNEFIGFARIR